ncbi:hypothetical protein B0J15DRAFT_115179 [Fusarium solani]|uniref:Secreted protein n=1 Tax=Fusarium solani TaxID=169388 RepID=A0A9P9L4S2_FUSSL|nr:uncharacterized protein B0J15DRAFT_115179 [Fusarium solani]KAH7273956.1 hypothetical protein B0J15DRAFT_115179 [Fusarium solani]
MRISICLHYCWSAVVFAVLPDHQSLAVVSRSTTRRAWGTRHRVSNSSADTSTDYRYSRDLHSMQDDPYTSCTGKPSFASV